MTAAPDPKISGNYRTARPQVPPSPDRLLFRYSGSDVIQREKVATITFSRIRKRAGLDEKFTDYKVPFHKIHFHLFRKFFLTKGTDTIGEHAAHSLCGHSFYMDTYYRRSAEERQADYLRLMPKLTIFPNEKAYLDEKQEKLRQALVAIDLSVDDKNLRDEIRRMVESSPPKKSYDEVIDDIKAMLEKNRDDPIIALALSSKKETEQVPLPSPPQNSLKRKILCTPDQVQAYLDQNYMVKYEMKNGSVVMSLKLATSFHRSWT